MKASVYIATSLDGFIATRDGGLEWLTTIPNPENSDFGFAAFLGKIDALVMGRNTFEKVLSFDAWPYTQPVFVLSRSLPSLPSQIKGKAELVASDVDQLWVQLEQRGYQQLYIDGGQVIRSFLKQDLIDELFITQVPVLLGEGIPLFGDIGQVLAWRHVRTEVWAGGLVKNCYRRNRLEESNYGT